MIRQDQEEIPILPVLIEQIDKEGNTQYGRTDLKCP